MDVRRGARRRHRTAGLHVQDPGRHDQRRRRRSQATQPRGTGSGDRAQVSDFSRYVAVRSSIGWKWTETTVKRIKRDEEGLVPRKILALGSMIDI